jgi:hypothetical protein
MNKLSLCNELICELPFAEEIDRLFARSPDWQDDAFVPDNVSRWRA